MLIYDKFKMNNGANNYLKNYVKGANNCLKNHVKGANNRVTILLFSVCGVRPCGRENGRTKLRKTVC